MVLCLQGRLAGLQRKLADIATFVFLDAPHVLPLWYKPIEAQLGSEQQQQQQQDKGQQCLTKAQQQQQKQQLLPQALPAPKRAWLLSDTLLAAQPELQALFQAQQQSHAAPQISSTSTEDHAAAAASPWQLAPADVATQDQHLTQCCGWQQSWHVIQEALSGQQQHIDGLLGFSQGSAVAAVVAALLQQQRQQQAAQDQQQQADAAGAQTPAARSAVAQRVKFMILASGFVSPVAEHLELLQQQRPLQLPSLHVYAAAEVGSDRQIQQQLSDELFDQCAAATRQRILHDCGHLIPCRREVMNEIRAFLQQFQNAASETAAAEA